MADSRAGEFKSMLYITLSILTDLNRIELFRVLYLQVFIWHRWNLMG